MKSSSPKGGSDYVAISYSDGGSKKFASWIATSMVDGKIPPARESVNYVHWQVSCVFNMKIT